MLNYTVESDSLVTEVDIKHCMFLKNIIVIQNYR